MNIALVLRVLADVASETAARLEREEGERRAGWVDQHASPLGSRRHCAAVRRRVAAGDERAAVVGRRLVLEASALAEELSRRPGVRKHASEAPGKAGDVADTIRAELRLVRGR